MQASNKIKSLTIYRVTPNMQQLLETVGMQRKIFSEATWNLKTQVS